MIDFETLMTMDVAQLKEGKTKYGNTIYISGLILLPGGYTRTPVNNSKTLGYIIRKKGNQFNLRGNGQRCNYMGQQEYTGLSLYDTEEEAVGKMRKNWPGRVKRWLKEISNRCQGGLYCHTNHLQGCMNCKESCGLQELCAKLLRQKRLIKLQEIQDKDES